MKTLGIELPPLNFVSKFQRPAPKTEQKNTGQNMYKGHKQRKAQFNYAMDDFSTSENRTAEPGIKPGTTLSRKRYYN